jgi:hypothetical protein
MMDDTTPNGDENSVVGEENLQNGKQKPNEVEMKKSMFLETNTKSKNVNKKKAKNTEWMTWK